MAERRTKKGESANGVRASKRAGREGRTTVDGPLATLPAALVLLLSTADVHLVHVVRQQVRVVKHEPAVGVAAPVDVGQRAEGRRKRTGRRRAFDGRQEVAAVQVVNVVVVRVRVSVVGVVRFLAC